MPSDTDDSEADVEVSVHEDSPDSKNKLMKAISVGQPNTFRFLAMFSKSVLLQLLAEDDELNPAELNEQNSDGETPLHIACRCGRYKNAATLLANGAKPDIPDNEGAYPIHYAVRKKSVSCIKELAKVPTRTGEKQFDFTDKNGNAPIHIARSKECVYTLADLGCDLELKNKAGLSALDFMIQKGKPKWRFECALAILVKGAQQNSEPSNLKEATTLELAINNDDVQLVQALIVFGADVNQCNKNGESPRHIVASKGRHGLKHRHSMLYLLHRVGANRCPVEMPNCSDGCKHGVDDFTWNDNDMGRNEFPILDAITNMLGGLLDTERALPSFGDKVLCLDGGGTKVLVMIQILQAIQSQARREKGDPTFSIATCFDWIGGTSGGGIVAAGMVYAKKTLEQIRGLFFELKDDVLEGKKPYDNEPLENILEREFGKMTMTNELKPKILIHATMGDRHPCQQHVFKNYVLPDEKPDPEAGNYPPVHPPNKQLVWEAVRSTGAAPLYFNSFEQFLDGGLMANNPSLDVLTSIQKYNKSVKRKPSNTNHIRVLLSIGTGEAKRKLLENPINVGRPEDISHFFQLPCGVKNLLELVTTQATRSDGPVVERCMAWCSTTDTAYYRLDPQMSKRYDLDVKKDDEVLNMLWETQCYLYDNKDAVANIAKLLIS